MQESQNLTDNKAIDEEIDFIDFFKIISEGKWIIISITSLACVIVVIYSLLLPNIYQSKALLVPNESSSSTLNDYGGLASIAGLSIAPKQGPESNSYKAIEKLNTLSFFENNILPNIFLPNLMAIEKWDPKKNKIIYDEEIYDATQNKWVRDFTYPQKLIPSSQESFSKFKEQIIISQDRLTGFVTIVSKHQSPYVAKNWVELIVDEVNSFYREKDKEEAEKAANYLNMQIIETNFSEIKQVTAELLEQEIQTLTLIEANDFYVYEYIDPPAVMEEKSEPRRSIICIMGAFIGLIISIVVVFLRHLYINKANLLNG